MEIALGSKVQDTITGFTGIAVAYVTYLNSCARWGVQSADLHDGKPMDVEYFDEARLEIVLEQE